jgi:hypothetical protein
VTASPESNKARLIILADMGNEPDEEQQMVHMLMCSNRFDLDGLIAVTGKYLRTQPLPELFHRLLDGYSEVLDNLKLHADGWHSVETLRSITGPGQHSYGMADVGDGKSSFGSNLIVKALEKDDPRPVYVVVNAGSNTLAQALWDCRAVHSPAEMKALVGKLRVFENGAQDNAGAWACHNFPNIHWMRSNYQTYAYGGPREDIGPYKWEPYEYSPMGQHHWLLQHVIVDHGPLGTLFPFRLFRRGTLLYKEGGGTTPWLGLLNPGLYDPDHPWWGGWSGRFTRDKVLNYWSRHADVQADEETCTPFTLYQEASDAWTDPETGTSYENIYVPVWRWRRAMYNDFKCRMDWCVKPYEEANHHPKAVLNGDEKDEISRVTAHPGETINLDASGSHDPDDDPLAFSWWVYKEAGSYPNDVAIAEPDAVATTVTVPDDAAGKQIHVILEVRDKNPIGSLYDYRRIVIDVA